MNKRPLTVEEKCELAKKRIDEAPETEAFSVHNSTADYIPAVKWHPPRANN